MDNAWIKDELNNNRFFLIWRWCSREEVKKIFWLFTEGRTDIRTVWQTTGESALEHSVQVSLTAGLQSLWPMLHIKHHAKITWINILKIKIELLTWCSQHLVMLPLNIFFSKPVCKGNTLLQWGGIALE